jgi:hypothetical protein
MAKAAGIGAVSVQRIWQANGLTPHRMQTFKLSNDPSFAEKFGDVVGLYVDPPERHIKEGKNAVTWTRLSCTRFAANAVRLQLHALAYNLATFCALWRCRTRSSIGR